MTKVLCVSYDSNFIGFDAAMQLSHAATFQILQQDESLCSALPEPAICRKIFQVRPDICFVDRDISHKVSRIGLLKGIDYSPILCMVGAMARLDENDFDFSFLPRPQDHLSPYVDHLLRNPIDTSKLTGVVEFNWKHYRTSGQYEHRLEKSSIRGPTIVKR